MNWIQIASTIVLAGAALAVIAKVLRSCANFLGKVMQFLDDWQGEPERPGISPARPGMLERVSALEASAKVVQHEITPNGGSSLKDQVNRIEANVVAAEDRPS